MHTPGSCPITVGLRTIRATGYGPAGHVTAAGTTRGQGIIGISGEVNRTQVLQPSPATDSPVRKHAHLTPPRPSTSILTKLRTAMINTSQHNLRRATESLRQSRMNRNRRSEAIYTGSRDRTRTYNLPVNSRTLCRLSYAGSRGTGGAEPASATALPGSPAGVPLCRRPAYPCRDLRVAYPRGSRARRGAEGLSGARVAPFRTGPGTYRVRPGGGSWSGGVAPRAAFGVL